MSSDPNWKEEGDGPLWLPTLNATEDKYAIPTDLLARVAYQESRFRRDIIDGTTQSPAGAVGIMQLLPRYFPGAGESPASDIDTAGKYLSELYTQFRDWQKALAAYNWGPGNVRRCLASGNGLAAMPTETQNYVTQICTDVPTHGALYG